MFYSQDILQKRGGKFGIIWIAATRAVSLSKRDYSSVQIRRTCEDIIQYITLQATPDRKGLRPRFSLYLSSQLMFGVCRVYNKQQQYLFTDTTALSIRFQSATYQSTARIDLKLKRTDEQTIPEEFDVLRDCEPYLDFGSFHQYSDVRLEEIPDIDCWTYQNGPYEPRTPPPVEGREMLRFSDVGPDGQPLADIPLPTESPKTPEHLSFRAELGSSMQLPNTAITMREDMQDVYRMDDIIVPGDQDLPPPDAVVMEQLSSDENMVDMDVSKDGASSTDKPTEGPTTAPMDIDEQLLGAAEETPAVMVDPATLGLEDRPERQPPPSPGVTPIQPVVSRRERRAQLEANLTMHLSPITETDTPSTKRRKRQLFFADRDTQLPQQQLKQQTLSGEKTCREMEYPRKDPTLNDMLNRPYSKAILRNSAFLALWRRNLKTSAVEADINVDLEYPIWTVPELGQGSSSSEGGSPRSAPIQPPSIPTASTDEEPIQEEQQGLPPPPELDPTDMGVSIEALREASVSRIEIGRDASSSIEVGRNISRLSVTGDLGDSLPHISLLSRSRDDSSHTLSTTGDLDSTRKSTSSRKRRATASLEEPGDITLGSGEQFGLQDIPEDQELPTDTSLLRSALGASPILAPPSKSPRLEEEQAGPALADGGPAPAGAQSPLPHHRLMRSVKKGTKTQKYVLFHEVCPFTENKDRAARVFSALLDLCALQRLAVQQYEPFTDIYISKGRTW